MRICGAFRVICLKWPHWALCAFYSHQDPEAVLTQVTTRSPATRIWRLLFGIPYCLRRRYREPQEQRRGAERREGGGGLCVAREGSVWCSLWICTQFPAVASPAFPASPRMLGEQ